MFVKSLPNPAWLFLGNVVSHMAGLPPSATHPRFDKPAFSSRRQLTPVFDKPAFSRFYQLFQPRLAVHSFGKIVKRHVCVKNGGELPTAGLFTIFQNSEPLIVVEIFGKIVKRQVCVKNGGELPTSMAICPKWRLSKKRGRVADARGWHICQNVRNGDCPTNGKEWHTPGRCAISAFVSLG